MKVARPILVIRFPLVWKMEEVQKASSSITKSVKDEYFVFTLKCPSVNAVKFEVYNANDVSTIDLEELKKKILEPKK